MMRRNFCRLGSRWCFFFVILKRYHGAHVLLHALQYQTQSPEDRNALSRYKDAVEKRLHILEEQGFVRAFETTSH